MVQRTLSKSDFKVARTCDAKLYFRENGYPDNRESDPYLALLSHGGYMVEALAKSRYADGVQLEYGGNVAQAFASTREYMSRPSVTLFEATLLVGRRQARVDILEKKGNIVRLLEIKAKSFNGDEHKADPAGAFRGSRPPHAIRAEWREKLEDITYQVLLLRAILPDAIIKPFLVLVDTSKRSSIDGIPQLFELISTVAPDGAVRLRTARYVGRSDQLADLDLVTECDVSAEVEILAPEVAEAAALYESRLDKPLSAHLEAVEKGSRCWRCEFRPEGPTIRSGFDECWGELAQVRPHMLELYSIGTAKAPDGSGLVDWMLRSGKAALVDIPEDGLKKADGKIGPQAERQRRQIEYTRLNQVYLSSSLKSKIASLKAPFHFIDFETSRLALPYHSGMRPYGLVTFQWSAHSLEALGTTPLHSEWLNQVDLWPNQSFAESLRDAIGDSGSVFTWSHFEQSVLKEILGDLAAFGRDVPGLVEWMANLFDHRIIDLHEWAKGDYYTPSMRGRTSIKVVLDAIWESDTVMHRQFEEWTGLTADPVRDPYSSLPPVAIKGVLQDVHEGTGAMLAYQEMMYGEDKNDIEVKAQWAILLKQYCSLDTLSMVLILEHWRRQVGLA